MKAAKQVRVERERIKKLVARALPRVFAAIELGVGCEQMVIWIRATKSFPELLKNLAQSLNSSTDLDNPWLHGICCLVTDFFEYFTPNDTTPIETPQEIILWFARFLQELFTKPELSWEGKIFTAQNIKDSWTSLEQIQQNKI